MGTLVRRIQPAEWPVLRELRLRSLLDAPEAFGQMHERALAEADSEWQAAARASADGDRRAWFIAAEDGADVGLVQARRRPPDECLVFSMWVAPGARRSGVGRLLIAAVDDWAAEWGASRIVLWVFGANEDAQRFYARIGFTFVNQGPDADSGRSYGALAMARDIGSRRA